MHWAAGNGTGWYLAGVRHGTSGARGLVTCACTLISGMSHTYPTSVEQPQDTGSKQAKGPGTVKQMEQFLFIEIVSRDRQDIKLPINQS